MANAAEILKKAQKDFGDQVAKAGASLFVDTPRLPSGIFPFDLASGGGFPMGRVSVVYGPESCLDAETFIQYEVRTSDGKRQNHKGGTIEHLYHRFNGIPRKGKGFYQRASTVSSEFTAPCVNENGRVFHNVIVGVVQAGVKDCLEVTTSSGLRVVATADHKFHIGSGFVRLGDLSVGDSVMIHNNTPYTKESKTFVDGYRKVVYVKNHPHAPTQNSGGYEYKRLVLSRAMVEAGLNDLTLEDFVVRLNSGNLSGLQFLSSDDHVHHRDEDFTNNDPLNLEIISASNHGRMHALERHDNLRYMAVEDTIVSIVPVGSRMTYDIQMESPHNNFVADGFVVHNSNKTNVVLKAIGLGQKLFPDKKAVFVDAEGGYDPIWAKILGVDVDNLIVVQPEYAEQAVDIIEAFLYAEDVFVVALDSVAALSTQNEINSSAEKMSVGGASLVIGKLFKKATVSFNRMRNQGIMPPAFIGINQIRHKIGVMYGDPECVTAGTLVNFVDGRSIPMEEVVSKKLVGPVWAFNEASNSFEPRMILSHHINGSAKDGELITLRAGGYDTLNGTMSATVSFTHKFLTASGWKRAGELTKSDLLVSRFRTRVNGTTLDFLRGASCGDLTLATRNPATGGHTTEIRIQDSENPAYADWKASKLSAFTFTRIVTASGRVRHVSNASYSLTVFKGEVSGRSPVPLLSNFTWLGFSVWVMDDAHFQESHGRYFLAMGRYRTNPEMRSEISAGLNLLGLDHKWKQDKQVVFTVSASKVIASNIAKYVPPCMQHKLPAGYRGQYEEFSLGHSDELVPVFVPIHEIGPASKRQYRDPTYYDIHVEGLNNYSVGNMDNGFVVHNTMPGGNALKFASSFTVRLYGKNEFDKKISDTMPAYKETNIVIKKWKMPILSQSAVFKMQMLSIGDVPAGTVADWNTVSSYLKQLEYLSKNGTKGWVMFGEEFPTLDACKEHLYSSVDLLNEAKSQIIEELLLVGSGVGSGGEENPDEASL